ncbi:MAG: hypothetical protein HY720_21115 [Planctomycetes bacterium]|nr:hypothetical protein [Planctomycetota bacterium]
MKSGRPSSRNGSRRSASVPGSTTSCDPEGPPPAPGVDLERREDRFLVHPKDVREVEARLQGIARLVPYPETPVTRTVYFGDRVRGLPWSFTVKGRAYVRDRLGGRWEISGEDAFDLLELKRTLHVRGRACARQAPEECVGPPRQPRGSPFPDRTQEVYELLTLLGEGLPDRDKEKRRTGRIRLAEILELLHDPDGRPGARRRNPGQGPLPEPIRGLLVEHLSRAPGLRWEPIVGTEYARKHFVDPGPKGAATFRATLDERIAYYSFQPERACATPDKNAGRFVGLAVGPEEAARLEVKVSRTGAPAELVDAVDRLVGEFLLFPVPSKKYRALSLRGRHLIERAVLVNEVPAVVLEARLPERGWSLRDGSAPADLVRFLAGGGPFRLLGEEPVLVEDHASEVVGSRGSLYLRIARDEVLLEAPPEVETAREATVLVAPAAPVVRLPVESHLDFLSVLPVEFERTRSLYRRSSGFLVAAAKSRRVFLVSLAQVKCGEDPGSGEKYVGVRYVGRVPPTRKIGRLRRVKKDLLRLCQHLGEWKSGSSAELE